MTRKLNPARAEMALSRRQALRIEQAIQRAAHALWLLHGAPETHSAESVAVRLRRLIEWERRSCAAIARRFAAEHKDGRKMPSVQVAAWAEHAGNLIAERINRRTVRRGR